MRKILSVCTMLLITSMLAGCSLERKKEETKEKKENLVWCIPARTQYISDEELTLVTEDINKQIEDLGIKLKLELYEVESYETELTEKITSDAVWDMAFTSNWLNDYISGSTGRYYAPLDDVLEKEGAGLYDVIPDYAWDSLTVNGAVYAVPNRQCWVKTEGYYIRSDLAEKYNFQCQTDVITPISSLEQFFSDVSKEENLFGSYADYVSRWSRELLTHDMTGLGTSGTLGAIRENDETLTVVNQFETEEFKEYCDRMRFWNKEGYIRKDSAVYSMNSSAVEQDKKNGRIAAEQLDETLPGMEQTAAVNFDVEYELLPVVTSKKLITSERVLSAATAINANSEHIEESVELIERIYEDSHLYNTFLYGIEGRHYEKAANGQISLIEDSGYGSGKEPALASYVIGDQYKSYTLVGTDADIWEVSSKWEKDAVPSNILGFNLKTNKISQEIAAVTAVIDSELRLLDTGSVDVDEFLPQFLEKLEDAGSKRIIDECQKQLTQWTLKRSKNEQE